MTREHAEQLTKKRYPSATRIEIVRRGDAMVDIFAYKEDPREADGWKYLGRERTVLATDNGR